MMKNPEMSRFILVAGFDYLGTNVSFLKIAKARAKQILNANPRKPISIKIYDFLSGKIFTLEKLPPNWTLTEKVDTTFEPITKRNYPKIQWNEKVVDSVFIPSGTKVMSIIDIYLAIIETGEKNPGQLGEVSFFSHASWEGPILVNSYEGLRIKLQSGSVALPYLVHVSAARDSYDRDPRASKDFNEPNMIDNDLKLFAAAYKEKIAINWIWGCNDDDRILAPFQQTFRSEKYTPHGVSDEQIFSYKFTKKNAEEFYASDISRVFYPAKTTELSFKRKFLNLKQFANAMLLSTYASQISKASKRVSYGALPGTFANYATEPMIITLDRKSVLNFFKNYMKVKLDPMGHRYGTFDPPEEKN